MLYPQERQFMDLYIREMHLGQNDGHAHRLSAERGITYGHYLRLEPAYMEYWGGAGHWGAPIHLSPMIPTFLVPGAPKKDSRLGSPSWNPWTI